MAELSSLDDHTQQLIRRHLALVLEENETLNLTRIVNQEEAEVLHIEDSLKALEALEAAPSGRYGDLGTGGGYPGIPLAIASGRETMLIDSRKKKIEAVQAMVEKLGLEGVNTFAGRAELLGRQQPESFAVLTARALAKLPVLLELASPLLIPGGRLICYKANLEKEELDDALRVKPQTGMALISDEEMDLKGGFHRRLLVFEKTEKPQMKLPRREGEAQKNPL